MKRYKSLFPVLLIRLFIVSGFQYEAKGQVEDRQIQGNWNGTISFKEEYKGGSLLSGSWNETLINVTITDNKGRGTMKIDGETIGGGVYRGRVSCSGVGVVVLYDVIINHSEGTYRIVTTGPDCFNGTDLHSSGDITIDYEYGGKTLDVLSGTKTTVFEIPTEPGGTVTKTIRWNLVRSIDAELIVTPQNYDNWLPEPGRDELTKGSVMKIDLKVQGKNGQALSLKATKFELRLSNTSKEPGITLNMPLIPSSDSLPDLRFLEDNIGESIEEDQFIEIDCDDGKTGTATIASYDGGGWTTLTAIAILEDGSQIKGSLLKSGGDQEILIPKRAVGSNIATKWLNENADPGERDDQEKTAGNENHGDGLSAYEEYRGVISAIEFSRHPNKFGRLDPNRKELGICMNKNNLPLFREGVSWLENAASIKIIRLLDTEGDTVTRMFNKNFKTANVHKQYFLRLVKESLPPNVGGYTFGPGDFGGPSTTLRTAIDERQLRSAYQTFIADARPHQLKFTVQELIAQTIAHELAHGLNVMHHGIESREPIQNAYANSNPPYRIFRIGSNVPVTLSSSPFLLEQIGASNSFQSGDLSCLMIFNPYHKWAFSVGADGANIFNEMPMLPMGRRFCTSEAGTGVNAINGYLGNTQRPRGNCMKQINLKL